MQTIIDQYNNWPDIKLRHVFSNLFLDEDTV